MREPDACPLLTVRHLLRTNCPLVFFLFSLSFECPTDIVNFIPRAYSSGTNRFRARSCLTRFDLSLLLNSSFISFLSSSVLLHLTNVNLRCSILTPSSVQKKHGGGDFTIRSVAISQSIKTGGNTFSLLVYLLFNRRFV